MAQGVTLRGLPFTREHLLTGAVVHGGDQPPPTSRPTSDGHLCALISCLLDHGTLDAFLAEHKIDPGELRRRLKHVCDPGGILTADQITEREGTGTQAIPVATLGPDIRRALLDKVTRLLAERRPIPPVRPTGQHPDAEPDTDC